MIYRMKRNGAGLASICILATMVLVMMASTACLYFGKEDAINTTYPRDINLEFSFDELDSFSDENIKKLKDKLSTELRDRNIIPENRYFYRNVAIYGIVNGSDVETTLRNYNLSDGTSTYSINFVSLDYTRIEIAIRMIKFLLIMGKHLILKGTLIILLKLAIVQLICYSI